MAENASSLQIVGNTIEHVGGNGVFLSNSVDNVTVSENYFRFLGTSGVLLAGRTGAAMMDGTRKGRTVHRAAVIALISSTHLHLHVLRARVGVRRVYVRADG